MKLQPRKFFQNLLTIFCKTKTVKIYVILFNLCSISFMILVDSVASGHR